MTEAEKAAEWVRFCNASQPSYRLYAVAGVLREGDAMLAQVLKLLKCEKSADLIRWAQE